MSDKLNKFNRFQYQIVTGNIHAVILIAMQGDEVILHEVLSYDISDLSGGFNTHYIFNTTIDNTIFTGSEDSIRFGIYINSNQFGYNYVGIDPELLPEKFGVIEFANIPNIYERGTNFILNYEYIDGVYETGGLSLG